MAAHWEMHLDNSRMKLFIDFQPIFFHFPLFVKDWDLWGWHWWGGGASEAVGESQCRCYDGDDWQPLLHQTPRTKMVGIIVSVTYFLLWEPCSSFIALFLFSSISLTFCLFFRQFSILLRGSWMDIVYFCELLSHTCVVSSPWGFNLNRFIHITYIRET